MVKYSKFKLINLQLEKVVGYEQRRRIRAQIRIAKKNVEKEQINLSTTLKIKQSITKETKLRSPDRLHKSPERKINVVLQKTVSPSRQISQHKSSSPAPNATQVPLSSKPHGSEKEDKSSLNEFTKEKSETNIHEKLPRPKSPSKLSVKLPTKSKSPMRTASPDKKRPTSPTKSSPAKPKSNRFNEYASAYMKKVGLKDEEKTTEISKVKKISNDEQRIKKMEKHTSEANASSIISKKSPERTVSHDNFEVNTTQINGKRSPSPENTINKKNYESDKNRVSQKRTSPVRKTYSPERIAHSLERNIPVARSPSPKRPQELKQKSDTDGSKTQTKEVFITTTVDIDKKIPQKQKQEEKPSWVVNRNLKKTSETRTFTTKKVEPEKPKYRAVSPSKVISKPIDVITSSYGPGPLDADGRPLFGIKALRNGASNYQGMYFNLNQYDVIFYSHCKYLHS